MKIIKTSNYKKKKKGPISKEIGIAVVNKAAQDIPPQEPVPQIPNPLDGKSNQSARNLVSKLVYSLSTGIFSDESWEGVRRIWDALDDNNINWDITDNRYLHDERGNPTAKEWKFEINFTNNKGRPTTLYGTLTAHGAGSVQSPLDKYDISVMVG